tara:strand:- start:322 stop:558 length:237 start_codon:yes stop_codon:yes gene_type:complete
MLQLNDKINIIMNKLENIKNTHPNISSVWKNHLELREKKFVDELERCEKMLDLLQTKPDISLEMIQFIVALMKVSNNT